MEDCHVGETNGTYYHPDQQVIQNLDNFHGNGNEEEEVGDESRALSAENENYLPASELLKTDDPAEWDILLGHGGVSTSNTKWERESLYQNFDPLVSLAEKKAEFAVPVPPQNPRIELVKEATSELTPGVLISLTPPQGTLNGRHARESITLDEPERDEQYETVIKSEQPEPEDISPQDCGPLSIQHQDDAQLGSQTPNYSDGTYSVHSSDVETDHSECHNHEEDVFQPEATFVKPTSSIRAPKAARSQRPSENLNVTFDGKEFASDLQEVNDVTANETFVSTDSFQSALTNVEWDLLVDRGTGSCSAATKWERESLAQKFDPLVSLREQQRLQDRRANAAAAVHELGDSLEESSSDGPHPHALKAESKLISIDTPPHSKIRGNMTIRSEDKGDHDDSETNEFSESHLEHSGDEAFPDEVLSSDDLEIKKLKEHLEIQARNFQEQMTQRSLKLKEIEEAITSASRKLDAQQQSNRVLKEYEKSIGALEGEIDRIKRQITKTDAERKKIAEERDYAADDLRQAELAFSDLHNKYERVKVLIGNFKRNEDILVNRYDLMKVKLQNRDAQLKRLNDVCEDTMNRMKNDYESRIKIEDLEGNRMRAQIRKFELRISTVEKDLEQKAKENAQLSHLCDDLITGQRN